MRLKHLSALFALSISLASCGENDALVDALEKDNATPQSEIRSIDEAYEIAAQSLTWFDSADSRSSVRLLPSKNEVKVLKSKESRGESSDTLMYVVNFQDEEGFAIIPANRNMPELLAVTESGSYDPVLDSEVEPFNEYMKNAISVMAKSPKDLDIDTLRLPFMETCQEQTQIILGEIKPKAPYKWGQTGFEGMYCSNKICGCSNLAVALCMAYFQYPDKIVLYHHNDSIIYPDWADIRKHDATKDVFFGGKLFGYGDKIDLDAHYALGRICRELGYRSNSTYYDNATGTSVSGTIKTLKGLGFRISHKVYSLKSEFDELKANNFVIAYGTRIDDKTGKESGHMWVLDGYKIVKYIKNVYVREKDPNRVYPVEPEWELVRTETETGYYTHHNWGWKGECNGYFYSSSSWMPGEGVEYDNTDISNSNSYNYNIGNGLLIINK